MMKEMVQQRGGTVYGMDDRYMSVHKWIFINIIALLLNIRYCIDNGAMIAWAGMEAFKTQPPTPFEETWCTQRYDTSFMRVHHD